MKYQLVLGLLLSSVACGASALEILEATARATIPGAANSAAFMTIKNDSDSDVELISARSKVGQRVELHNHINDNGVMRMRPVQSIAVPSGQTVELKPGGLHVMLMGLNQELEPGEQIAIELVDKQGRIYPVSADVVDIRTTMKPHGKHTHD